MHHVEATEATPGWRDIGGEAAMSQEFGAAVEAFVQVRKESGILSGVDSLGFCFMKIFDVHDMCSIH